MRSDPFSTNIRAEHGGGTGANQPAQTLRPILARSRRGKRFWRQGEPLVWATGGALAFTLLLVVVLIAIVAVNGLGVFWPHQVNLITLDDNGKILGIRLRSEVNPDNNVRSIQYKTGNREFDPGRMDFHWYEADQIRTEQTPVDVFVLERLENGDFIGFLQVVKTPTLEISDVNNLPDKFFAALSAVRRKQLSDLEPIKDRLDDLSYRLQGLRLEILRAEYRKKHALEADSTADVNTWDVQIKKLQEQQGEIKKQSNQLLADQSKIKSVIRQNVALFTTASGTEVTIPLQNIVRAYQPNAMNLLGKVGHYCSKIGELLTAEPRESNTEGGLFPAIFGTVMLIFLMAVTCFPLGVLAGIYLGEYAKEGKLVRLVRIAVNNLAGIPSIVYGIFGLGFFIYGIGAWIDQWLYPELVEAGIPTFGTGGVLWASLTLGLLTVPVVIVATEEAMRAIPQGVRESSLALGATKFQTLARVMIPMASPGIMTGFILAMARAAG
ncbi:MAG TPA: ABC transporter permease subunit, partial [Thermoguttaceae bacterium]